MEVEAFDDARRFRSAADTLLLASEAVNNLILGVTGSAIDYPDAFEDFVGWIVNHSGEPVAAAARTPPHNLILAAPRKASAVAVLANHVGDLPGVVAVAPWVHQFVEMRPERARLEMTQGIFELTEVVASPAVEGLSRQARADEVDELVELRLAFEDEAIGRVEDPALARRSTEWRVREQSSRLGLWVHEVDGQVTSMAGHSGPTPNGIRVGPVYTPPQHRGRGYASALVAAESQWLLDNGHSYCFLYTDLANPTSNAIYQRIGYRQVAESAEYAFSPSI